MRYTANIDTATFEVGVLNIFIATFFLFIQSNLIDKSVLLTIINIEKTLRLNNMKITKELTLQSDKNQILNKKTGTIITLEPRLSHILYILLSNRGEVVTRESIVNDIWGNYSSGPDLLTHSISLLRKSIGKDIIVTIPKRGYIIHTEYQSVFDNHSFFKKYYWALILGVIGIKIFLPFHH
ncbi:winged helix-turn-helix domain-containing protein [Ekhidna sp.]|uniref:winged helix-turn-helix domain-containing protein n=1 Tax=Ekhidna sp. TaxID=2608089 RepID=UPI003B501E35